MVRPLLVSIKMAQQGHRDQGLAGAVEPAALALQAWEGRCGCAPDTSWYGCLRSYSNQFAHASLARGAVDHYLGALLVRWQERWPT